MKSAQGRFDSSLPSKQRAGELEYLPWSAHNMHKTGNVGPQKDMHIDKIGHFGPHRCTHAQDRPVRPTEVIDTHTIWASGRGSNLPLGTNGSAMCRSSQSQGELLPDIVLATFRRVSSYA